MYALLFALISIFVANSHCATPASKQVTKADVLAAKKVCTDRAAAWLQDYNFPREIAQLVWQYCPYPWTLRDVRKLGFPLKAVSRPMDPKSAARWRDLQLDPDIAGKREYKTLDISGLGLSSIYGFQLISQISEIDYLDASNNELQLTKHDEKQLRLGAGGLKFADFSHNKLANVPRFALESDGRARVTHLNLSNNPGLTIPEQLLGSIEVLLLSSCGLTEINGQHFTGNWPRLRILDFTGNDLTEIPKTILALRSLQHVYADQNRLDSPQPLSAGVIHSANQRPTNQ